MKIALRTTIFAACVAVSVNLAACDKEGNDGTEGEADTGAVELTPYDGPLTTVRLEAAKDAVAPFQDWDEAMALLQHHAGPPTGIDGTDYYWAVVEDGKCSHLHVENSDGQVGITSLTSNIDPMVRNMWAECAVLAGVEVPGQGTGTGMGTGMGTGTGAGSP